MDRKIELVKKGIAISDLAIKLGKDCRDVLRSYIDNLNEKGAINEIKTEEIQPLFSITAEDFEGIVNFMTEFDNMLNNKAVTQGDWLKNLNIVRSSY